MSHVSYIRAKQERLARQGRTKEKEEAMSSMFAQPPAPSAGFTMKDHLSNLILIEVLGTKEGLNTANGPADVIQANVTVLESDDPKTYNDTILFGKVIYSQLRNSVGQKVLGRVSQGNSKPGQSAPWILAEASVDDIAKAEAWVKANAEPAITSAQAPF